MQIRPRRSVLYMPGSNARALEKAKTLAADALILDLEDAVAPEAKEPRARQVCAAVKAGGYGQRELSSASMRSIRPGARPISLPPWLPRPTPSCCPSPATGADIVRVTRGAGPPGRRTKRGCGP